MPSNSPFLRLPRRLLPAGCLLTAVTIVALPTSASAQQILDVNLNLQNVLTGLVGTTASPTTPTVTGVVNGLLTPGTGLLSQLEAAVNVQGDAINLLDAKVGNLASVQLGLDGLRSSVDVSSADHLRRLNALDDGQNSQNLRLASHDSDIGELRRGDTDQDEQLQQHDDDISELRAASSEQSSWNDDMNDAVKDHEVRVSSLETAASSSLGQVKTQTNMMSSMASQTVVRLDEMSGRLDQTNAVVQQHGKALEAMSSKLQSMDGRIDTANEGVAMALALKAPAVAADKTFAVSGGWGTFEGENAFAMSGAVRANDYLQVDAGVAVGASDGSVGGRAGATLSW
jgi:hypothetical protein